jgi:hypothetical protein
MAWQVTRLPRRGHEQVGWDGQLERLAVLRLRVVSNLVGAWTGKSPGFAPLVHRSLPSTP